MIRRLVFAVALLLAGIALLPAQGTRADYERARNLRRLTENKVFRDRVKPHWLEGNAQFWYQVKTGLDTHEFILVDAEKGARQPAFDHARLAKSLAEAKVKDARPERLPLDKLEIKPMENALLFRAGGRNWRCDLKTYEVREQPATKDEPLAALSALNAPKASTRTGPESSLTFVNRTPGEVELFWLNSDGERQSYGKLRAGEEREQHTYAGHVWLAADDAGRTLAVFQAEEPPARGEITGQPRERARPQAGSRARRASSRETSPDGRWRAFVKDDNVMVRDLDLGEDLALSSDGQADDAYGDRVYWSPDSKKLVAIRTKQGEEHKVYL